VFYFAHNDVTIGSVSSTMTTSGFQALQNGRKSYMTLYSIVLLAEEEPTGTATAEEGEVLWFVRWNHLLPTIVNPPGWR